MLEKIQETAAFLKAKMQTHPESWEPVWEV